MKNLLLLVLLAACGPGASAETSESVVDDGYSFTDGGRRIRQTESDGVYTEIIHSQSGIPTPCAGINLPPERTRQARVEPALSCDGQFAIHQPRVPENFERLPTFREAVESGDQQKMFEIMRANTKNDWRYTLNYSTRVNWTWVRHMKGKNGSRCGYTYTSASCQRKIEVRSRRCWYVPDPSPSYSPGGGGGGFSPGGGGGGGGGYERTNPFGFLFDLALPKAYAGEECSAWSYSHRYESFTCYDRQVQHCDWKDTVSDSMTCSTEKLPIQVSLPPKPESEWNPRRIEYVPFLPNGNDLLPGERETLNMTVRVAGGSVTHSTPQVTSGIREDAPPFYTYRHEVQVPRLQCRQNASNETFKWTLLSQDRQVTKTPNSLEIALPDQIADTHNDLDHTGLFDEKGNPVLRSNGRGIEVTAVPAMLRILDTSSGPLNAIAAAFRQTDGRTESDGIQVGDTVTKGKVTAGSENRFWKDTFYRVQLLEVFPGRWKKPISVAEMLIQTDSLVRRHRNLISLPLAGQYSDTPSAYDQTSSGLVIPKGYYRTVGTQYIMIPGQTYELRLSLLHRGIPFYHSGCDNNAVSCEREAPNLKAFSEEKILHFKYSGAERRGFLRRYYDFMRRVSPW